MPIREYKPRTPATRGMSVLDFSELTVSDPKKVKSLMSSLPRTGGRNHHGRMTSRHRGGRAKRQYRHVDFKRLKNDMPAVVEALEYDPNRSANIALVRYSDNELSYILAPEGLKVGAKVLSSASRIEPNVGNSMPMGEMPQGIMIHNIELNPGAGASLVRSAGSGATLMAKEGKYVVIVLPSGEMRRTLSTCRATVGQVGNLDYRLVTVAKAGRARHMGMRPKVRGIAMNPVDHPMGGGKKRRKGHHPQSPWGLYSKGKRTRSRSAKSNSMIIRRRKSKKKKS